MFHSLHQLDLFDVEPFIIAITIPSSNVEIEQRAFPSETKINRTDNNQACSENDCNSQNNFACDSY